jgi:hypothetical protein
MFVNVLGALDQISDQAFRSYEIADATTRAMRERFATWRNELRATA